MNTWKLENKEGEVLSLKELIRLNKLNKLPGTKEDSFVYSINSTERVIARQELETWEDLSSKLDNKLTNLMFKK